MGERLLQVGVGDPAFSGALAAKVGLSRTAVIVVPDGAGRARADRAVAAAGTLVDVTETPLDSLPMGEASFDVVVVHAETEADFAGASVAALKQCHRVLRPGGRLLLVTAGAPTGLKALLKSAPQASAGEAALAALSSAGLRPVREVGELEGLRFTEGLKS